MQLEQLDLFNDYSDRTCPACGQVESNAYSLGINHGYYDGLHHGYQPGQHPIFGRRCDKQALIAHHLAYAVEHSDAEELEATIRKARACGLDVEAICAQANKEVA